MSTKEMHVWWGYLISGVLLVLLGWLVLAKPISAIVALVLFFGFYLFVAGIVEVVMSFFGIGKKGSEWGWELLAGILMVVAGLVVLNNSLFASVLTAVSFAYIVGFAFMINGVVKMVAGKRIADGSKSSNYVWTWGAFFLGLLYLLFGLFLLAGPAVYTVAKVATFSGWFAIVIGVVSVVVAFIVRGEEKKLA
jgi:uncharacterized membrane protein HdeD (DUF308 family)